MTPQQKNLITLLVVVNALVFCCGLPAVAVFFDLGGIQGTLVSFIPAPPSTATPRATVTPTRVLPTATLEANWKLYSVPADKFAIAAPASWNSVVLDPKTLSAQIEDLAKKNPQLGNSLKAQSQEALAKIKFVGIETDASVVSAGFAPNVNLIHNVETMDLTIDTVIDASKKELDAQKIAFATRRINMQAGEMVEFKFTVPLKLNSGQNVNLSSAQYVILRGRDSYSLSCVVLDKQAAKYLPICEKIALSFRWAN